MRDQESEYSALRRRYGLTVDKREPWPIRLREWWRLNVWYVAMLAFLGFCFWVLFGDLILRWWFFGCPC